MAKSQRYQLDILSDMANLSRVADFIEGLIPGLGLDEKQTYDVEMAVDEAVTNVMEHGYARRKDGAIRITTERRGNQLVVEIQHFGIPLDPEQLKEPRISGPLSRRAVGGLGIFFMKRMMDSVEFLTDPKHGNRIRMTKRLK